MFNWLRKKTAPPNIPYDNPLVGEIVRLHAFLERLINAKEPKPTTLIEFTKTYFQQDAASIISQLPTFYFRYEQLLTTTTARSFYAKETIRSRIAKSFPALLELDHFGFIFNTNDQQKEILLCKIFLETLLDRIVQVLGQAQESFFKNAKTWVSTLPSPQEKFPPLQESGSGLENLKEELIALSFLINKVLKNKMGDHFAQKKYDHTYDTIAKSYKYLNCFPIVISLIPRTYLDTDKIGLMSNHQLSVALLEKVSYFEEFNSQLVERNLELSQARREIERAQKRLKERTITLEQTQSQLKLTIQELEETNLELKRYAYVASHDLQEPLRSVKGYLQLIHRQLDTMNLLENSAIDEYMGFASDGVSRMQRLIQDLLEYSKIDRTKLELQSINLENILILVKNNLHVSIDEASAIIEEDALPEIIWGMKFLVIQLFQNLLSNAIKFHKENQSPVVHLSAVEREHHWEFAISDNGIGIAPKDRERIFEIFQRLHGRNHYSGTGIGLAICRKIVELHGGKIWVEPSPLGGSCFRFTIKKDL